MYPQSSYPKKIAAKRAIDFIEDGMIIGVGSGSTVKVFIELLSASGIRVKCVPTSLDTELALVKYGLSVVSFLEVDRIDIAVDGADSILLDKKIILKGGGGALTREKIVDYAAEKFVVIVDETKIGRRYPIVIEFIPFAYSFIARRLREWGEPVLRMADRRLGPVITDNGNWLIDLHIPPDMISGELEEKIKNIPGIVEVGIFRRNTKIIIGHKSGDIEEIGMNA